MAQKPLNEQLVGLWKLTSHANKVVATGAAMHPFGQRPSGYQLFTRGGRMIHVIFGENRKAPAGTVPTDAERIALFRSVIAQSGTYKLDGNTILIQYDGSANQVLTGTSRTYSAEVNGNKLTLTSSPFASGQSGQKVISVRTFDRLE
jgi:hypothetical protein